MKAYPSFDAWLDGEANGLGDLVGPLRAMAKRVSKKLVETVKWGNGCWTLEDLPIAFAHAERDHIQFGFFAGSMLTDPKGVLTGSGKYVRSVKLRRGTDLQAPYLTRLFRQALTIRYR